MFVTFKFTFCSLLIISKWELLYVFYVICLIFLNIIFLRIIYVVSNICFTHSLMIIISLYLFSPKLFIHSSFNEHLHCVQFGASKNRQLKDSCVCLLVMYANISLDRNCRKTVYAHLHIYKMMRNYLPKSLSFFILISSGQLYPLFKCL